MMTAGKLAYALYFRPLGTWRRIMAEGGPREWWRTERGRRAMEEMATRLPVLPPAAGAPVELYVLTGRKFWYQTVFCLWSFAKAAGRNVVPRIYDDGSLGESGRDALRRHWPAARIVGLDETCARLEQHLPRERFPFLRDRWDNYPNIRKLTDVHAGARGWKLVIDSDLLFFREPNILLDWLDDPGKPLHALDVEKAYGYPDETMRALCGASQLPDRLNVGLCGLRGEDIDWQKLERWTRGLIERHGTHYYLEQALVAMLVAERQCTVAPESDYVTGPRPPEAGECRAVMHHYVSGSKRWYFRDNWRRVAGPGLTGDS